MGMGGRVCLKAKGILVVASSLALHLFFNFFLLFEFVKINTTIIIIIVLPRSIQVLFFKLKKTLSEGGGACL